MGKFKGFLPHLAALCGFVLISLLYFSPVLSNKMIKQSDIEQYIGMRQEINHNMEQQRISGQTVEEPYWTNSAFGGMPTYQLGARYPYNFVKEIDSWLRFLPRPADYLFVYFLGFYVLMLSMGVKPLRAFIGALTFGFSTYLIIILGVGHNAKAHAIAYMPMVLAGVMLVYRRKYVVGGVLTAFAASLEIGANHYQMTYYLLLLLLIVGVFYSYKFIASKQYKSLAISTGILVLAAILSIGANMSSILATAQYTAFSTRGPSELTISASGQAKQASTGLNYDYITEYSYGIFESFNLIAYRLTGGGNGQYIGKDSNLYKFASSKAELRPMADMFAQSAPTYWGDQPGVAAPAYIGAVVFFLFVLGMFVEKRKFKYIFLFGAIFSLMLSWGKNFPLLTDFFINYIPLYNKFRAVSSIQVILELCIPVMAIIGLDRFIKQEQQPRLELLKKSTLIVVGIYVGLLIIGPFLSFSATSDNYYQTNLGPYGLDFIRALIDDRQSMYYSDVIKGIVLVCLSALALYFVVKEKVKPLIAVLFVGVLMVTDLVIVDRQYVNDTNFSSVSNVMKPFQATAIDQEILKDTTHFRVFDVAGGGFNSGRASYFHKSLGGYHAAKPRGIQELVDYQLAAQNNYEILNMLEVKYIIQQNEQGEEVVMQNPYSNGNAWFVQQVIAVPNANEEMMALSELDTKATAVVNATKFPALHQKQYSVDSLAMITLTHYSPDKMVYHSKNAHDGVAVFSEIYYPHGWQAYIDGQQVPIQRVDYVLRALEIGAGEHKIEFIFVADVVRTGSLIAVISGLLMLLFAGGGIWYMTKKEK